MKEEIILKTEELKIIRKNKNKCIIFKHDEMNFGDDVYAITLSNLIHKYSCETDDDFDGDTYILNHYFSDENDYMIARKIIKSFKLTYYYDI
jgi:hypothetical protein